MLWANFTDALEGLVQVWWGEGREDRSRRKLRGCIAMLSNTVTTKYKWLLCT